LLVGLRDALYSLDGTGGGPSDGRVTADRATYSATILHSKLIAVFMSAGLIRAGNRESDLAAIVLFHSMTGKDQILSS